MPSKKFQHLIESGKAPFGRKIEFRPPAKSILIVCEGKNTEPIYFKLIRERKASSSVSVECYEGCDNDVQNLANYALELKRARLLKAKRRELGSREAKYDEIWIVFDADCYVEDRKNKFHKLNEGLAHAEKNKILVALSNPCFEYWLFLHLKYSTAAMSTCGEVINQINKVLPPDQKLTEDDLKNEKRAAKLIPFFIDKVETAVANAQRVRRYHETSGSPFPPTPSTDVDKLICSIVETIPPAHSKGCCAECK
jgi:hypothetical protein